MISEQNRDRLRLLVQSWIMSKERFVSLVSCLLGLIYSGNANFVTYIMHDDFAIDSSLSIVKKIKIIQQIFQREAF